MYCCTQTKFDSLGSTFFHGGQKNLPLADVARGGGASTTSKNISMSSWFFPRVEECIPFVGWACGWDICSRFWKASKVEQIGVVIVIYFVLFYDLAGHRVVWHLKCSAFVDIWTSLFAFAGFSSVIWHWIICCRFGWNGSFHFARVNIVVFLFQCVLSCIEHVGTICHVRCSSLHRFGRFIAT